MSARVPFGKFRGVLITELPDHYLEWLGCLSSLREPLRSAVQAEVERRRPRPNSYACSIRDGCPDPEVANQLISAGLRTLARQHHPDLGGSPQKMTAVNTAAEWLRRRVRSLSA